MASAPSGTLVVGAGQAGLSLVTRLRDLGDDQAITVVGDEAEPPYERPLLSKTYLRGEHDRSAIFLREPGWFQAQQIDLVTADEVVEIARDAAGGTARTASGRSIEFARLALATGAAPRPLAVEGAALDGVVPLRTLVESDDLARRLRAARDVVVVGGGFIGLEVAASARALGCRVTVVELTEHLLGRAVTPELSRFFRAAHERRGTTVTLATGVSRVVGRDGAVTAVALTDDTLVPADVVVVGVGAAPRTRLASRLGLDLDPRGIVVDRHALTSDGVTVAAGDCAVGPNPFSRGLVGLTRLESVAHADDQSRTAAATLLGQAAAYDAVPWFWSDQGELRLQIAGLPTGADLTVLRGDPASERFSVLSFRSGLLIAAECVGASADYVAAKRGLEKGMTVDPDAAADEAVPLKRLLVPV
ncbi:MAG: FAD-dependent oxidoreductase [Terracoccus sp.]